jgi:hypothetical protein
MTLPLPVAVLVSLLSTGPITIRRRGQPSINTYGEREPAPELLIEVDKAVVHPASAAVLEQHPVADASKDNVEVYTQATPLRTASPSGVADEVIWNGAAYKVIAASDYLVQGDVYFALAERLVPS